nr:MAG TPA: hypothetical protein [Caudoviricetes sp.]
MSSISVTPNLNFIVYYTSKNCIVATFLKKISCIIASCVV